MIHVVCCLLYSRKKLECEDMILITKKTKWIGDHAEFLIIMQGQNSVKQNHFGNISFNNETNYLGGKYLQLCFNYYLNGTTKKQWIIV